MGRKLLLPDSASYVTLGMVKPLENEQEYFQQMNECSRHILYFSLLPPSLLCPHCTYSTLNSSKIYDLVQRYSQKTQKKKGTYEDIREGDK